MAFHQTPPEELQVTLRSLLLWQSGVLDTELCMSRRLLWASVARRWLYIYMSLGSQASEATFVRNTHAVRNVFSIDSIFHFNNAAFLRCVSLCADNTSLNAINTLARRRQSRLKSPRHVRYW